jgi:hypothetical protein
LGECLGSLYKNYPSELREKEYEIIVVDNNSSDDSVTFIKKTYPKLHLLENAHNVGFSQANNQGISHAHGAYVLLLNPDTEVLPKTLNTLVSFMDKNSEVGVSTAKVVLPDGSLDDACHRGFPTPWRSLTHFSGLGSLFPQSTFLNGYHLGYQRMDETHEIDACVGAFMFIRASVGAKLNWLDTDYFWYGEDLDFCFRIKALGLKVMFVPGVSIIHHKGASSGLKTHSRHLSKIDEETSKKIRAARFEVMRIFYKKHYVNSYPVWLMKLVFLGINLKQKVSDTL